MTGTVRRYPEAAPCPPVRVVVLNYNGGDRGRLRRRHLARTDWPADGLELVVVDNASTDGSEGELRERRFPASSWCDRPARNLGFPANNVAHAATSTGVDYVALVNNDAFVEPGWLAPLVAALEADAGLGAACPRIVFAARFLDSTLESPDVPARAGRRPRPRGPGVAARGRRRRTCGGTPSWCGASGAWSTATATEARFSGPGAEALVRVPVPDGRGASRLRLRLAAEAADDGDVRGGAGPSRGRGRPRAAVGRGARRRAALRRGQQRRRPCSSRVATAPTGATCERDEGQYDEPAEVFAWCGGGVLLRPAYLDEVGLFDERFFLYYEDTDLSWRGRARGWRYRYVPDARSAPRPRRQQRRGLGPVPALRRAEPAADAGQERRRWAWPLGAVWRYLLITASYARRDVVGPAAAGAPAEHGAAAAPAALVPGVPAPAARRCSSPGRRNRRAPGRRRRQLVGVGGAAAVKVGGLQPLLAHRRRGRDLRRRRGPGPGPAPRRRPARPRRRRPRRAGRAPAPRPVRRRHGRHPGPARGGAAGPARATTCSSTCRS